MTLGLLTTTSQPPLVRPISLTLLLLMAFIAFPAADASETVTKPYIGGSASAFGRSVGILIMEGDYDEDGQPETPAIGGNNLYAAKHYRHAVISIADDAFGPSGGYNACFHPPESGLIGRAHCTGNVCGASTLLSSPYESDQLNIWTRAVMVQDDLNVCGATSGILTGMFF